MARSGESNPNPKVLAWARISSGLDPAVAAKRIGVSDERLKEWENGKSNPSFAQLRKLAEVYKRPMPVFYLEEVPAIPVSPADFRSPAGLGADVDTHRFSPELTYELRRSRTRRRIALDLYAENEESIPAFALDLAIAEDAESAARKIRDYLRIDMSIQSRWNSEGGAYGNWRSLLERRGILTFLARRVPAREARGFSLSDRPLPVITANIKDSQNGRIFTMIHELVHISLRRSGICDMSEHKGGGSEIENYCNRVAGAVLFPREDFLRCSIVTQHPQNAREWSDSEISALSRLFGASREAALVRLLNLGLTDQEFFFAKRSDIIASYQVQKDKDDNSGPPHHVVEMACAGESFVDLVTKSFSRQLITLRDASLYLNIDARHTAEIIGAAGQPARIAR